MVEDDYKPCGMCGVPSLTKLCNRCFHKKQRGEAVDDAIKQFGWDFYMCDSRESKGVKAASFRIADETDRDLFIREASSYIPWVASVNATASAKADSMISEFGVN